MKVSLKCRTWLNVSGVRAAVRQAVDPCLRRLALAVAAEAKRSMSGRGGGGLGRFKSRAKGPPSAPGTPPAVKSDTLRGSISVARTPRGVYLVGPTRVAWYGRIHEFGNKDRGGHHPPRPFMRPALYRVARIGSVYFRQLGLRRTPAGRACEAAVKTWQRSRWR